MIQLLPELKADLLTIGRSEKILSSTFAIGYLHSMASKRLQLYGLFFNDFEVFQATPVVLKKIIESSTAKELSELEAEMAEVPEACYYIEKLITDLPKCKGFEKTPWFPETLLVRLLDHNDAKFWYCDVEDFRRLLDAVYGLNNFVGFTYKLMEILIGEEDYFHRHIVYSCTLNDKLEKKCIEWASKNEKLTLFFLENLYEVSESDKKELVLWLESENKDVRLWSSLRLGPVSPKAISILKDAMNHSDKVLRDWAKNWMNHPLWTESE